MSQEQQKRDFNSTFTEIKKWTLTEKTNLVLSLILDNDTGKKSYFFNKQWTTKDGKKGTGKGATIPFDLVPEVTDSLKLAHAKESGAI